MLEVAILIAVVAATIVGVVLGVRYLRRHPEQRGSRGALSGLTGGSDEIWHPHAANARHDLDAEHHHVAPAPMPDPDRPDLPERPTR